MVPVDSIVNAAPTAITTPADLTEDYLIPNGVRVVAVNAVGTNTSSHMAGFFKSFNTPSVSAENGTNSLLAVQYPLNTSFSYESPTVLSCINLNGVCNYSGGATTNPWPMNTWRICFQSTRNRDAALLTVTSSGGLGAKTNLITGPDTSIC